jgi:hypothetical protein
MILTSKTEPVPRRGNRIEQIFVLLARTFLFASAAGVGALFLWRMGYATPYSATSLISYSVFFFCILGLFLSPKRLVLVFLLGSSTLATLVFVNIFLEYLGPAHSPEQAAHQSGVPFDSRLRSEVIHDLMAAGQTVVPPICPIHFVEAVAPPLDLMPLAGFPGALTVDCNESGHYSSFRSDRYGFNNPDSSYSYLGGAVLLLGDSFARGACVGEGRDPASVLRTLGRPSVTLGCGGNGPLASLGAYTEYADVIHPRYVVWLYYEGNDLNDLVKEAQTILVNYLRPGFSQRLVENSDRIGSALASLLASSPVEATVLRKDGPMIRLLTLYHVRGLLGLAGVAPTAERANVGESLFLLRQTLAEFKNRAHRDGHEPLFVYLPSYRSILGDGERSRRRMYAEDYKDEVVAVVHDLELQLLDFEETVLSHSDPLSLFPFRAPGHLNVAGYELLARSLDLYLSAAKARPE